MFCYQQNFFTATKEVDREQFWALVAAPYTKECIDKFRETGDAAWKKRLPAFIFQATFDVTTSKSGKTGTWRKQAATRLNGLVVMDIDHVESEELRVKSEEFAAADFKQRAAELGILLIYITPSGHGLKIVFKADPQKGNLIDNQLAMARVLGVECDESCKDASRMSFICTKEDILFINEDELFTYENKEFGERYNALYREGHSKAHPSPQKAHPSPPQGRDVDVLKGDSSGNQILPLSRGSQRGSEQGDNETDQTTPNPIPEQSSPTRSLSYSGGDMRRPPLPPPRSALPLGSAKNLGGETWRGYDVQSIIDARYGDKLPCAADSNRHNESLKLASDLLIMFDGDKQKTLAMLKAQPWVQEIIDERNENVEQTVDSAAQRMVEREKKYGPDLKLSKVMQEAVESTCKAHPSNKTPPPSEGLGEAFRLESLSGDGLPLDEWGREIEQLFDVFPCLREACQDMKLGGYPAALFTSAAFFGTLMTRTTWHHWFEPEKVRRLNYSVMIIGDPTSGKGFATRLYDQIAAPIKVADKVSTDAINRWKEDKSSKADNKEKPKKPHGIFRNHPARTANGIFIADMVNAVEEVDGEPMNLHLLTFDSELDNATLMGKGGQWIDKTALELKAFHNEEDGQAYANLDSYTGNFNVYWNFVYTGTPLSLDRKVNERNFGTGLATRLAVIPMPDRNFKLAPYGYQRKVDHAADELLKTWAFRLDGVKGELPIEPLVRATYDWQSAKMEVAAYDKDKALDMLLMRVPYYGIGIATPYVLMRHWDEWQEKKTLTLDEYDIRLCTLAMDIQFACQQFFFYAYAQAYFDNMNRDRHEKRRTRASKYDEAYKLLPEEFTIADIQRCYTLDYDIAKATAKRLCDNGFVMRIKYGKYKKIVKTLI